MKIRKMNWFVRMLTLNWASAITLAPFGIYIKEKYMNNGRVIMHELIHWEQQVEMLILPFYIWYLIEFLVKILFYWNKAYMNISFEREAFDNDDNYFYIGDVRKRFAWWGRIIK